MVSSLSWLFCCKFLAISVNVAASGTSNASLKINHYFPSTSQQTKAKWLIRSQPEKMSHPPWDTARSWWLKMKNLVRQRQYWSLHQETSSNHLRWGFQTSTISNVNDTFICCCMVHHGLPSCTSMQEFADVVTITDENFGDEKSNLLKRIQACGQKTALKFNEAGLCTASVLCGISCCWVYFLLF